MLVLTRKVGEQIIIGDNIRLTVVGIRGNRVRLSIRAPSETRILRKELRGEADQALPPSKSPGSEARPD
jgi:carbon storage regulator